MFGEAKMCLSVIKEFWKRSGRNPSVGFVADPENVWRCYTCGKGYKTESALKAHITRSHAKRQWHGSTADKDTRNAKRKAKQSELPQVEVDDAENVDAPKIKIDNVWLFRYLGSLFRADGDQHADIQARVSTAIKTAGQMRSIWASTTTPLALKLRIYRTGVCSKLVYGSEAWCLDERACAILNGANSRMMARITGKTIKEEASKATRTFDVVRWIRARRLQWIGHVLRAELRRRKECPDAQPRLIYKAMEFMHSHRKEGDLLIDVPDHQDWDDLCKQSEDKTRFDAW